MSFISNLEGDGKSVINNMVTNTAAMLVWQKVISDLVPKSESEYVNLLIAAGWITTVEELKNILRRAVFNLDLFHQNCYQ